MTTALGYGGIVLMHSLVWLRRGVEVYFIDPGFKYPDSLELADRIRKEQTR